VNEFTELESKVTKLLETVKAASGALDELRSDSYWPDMVSLNAVEMVDSFLAALPMILQVVSESDNALSKFDASVRSVSTQLRGVRDGFSSGIN
jgi:hypothetical protein